MNRLSSAGRSLEGSQGPAGATQHFPAALTQKAEKRHFFNVKPINLAPMQMALNFWYVSGSVF